MTSATPTQRIFETNATYRAPVKFRIADDRFDESPIHNNKVNQNCSWCMLGHVTPHLAGCCQGRTQQLHHGTRDFETTEVAQVLVCNDVAVAESSTQLSLCSDHMVVSIILHKHISQVSQSSKVVLQMRK